MFLKIISKTEDIAKDATIGLAFLESAPLVLSILTSLLAELAKTFFLSTLSSLLPWILVAFIIWQISRIIRKVYESRK